MAKKRILCIILVLAIAVAILSAASAAAEPKSVPMELRYDEPASSTQVSVYDASQWEAASLPIGNGILGANVFGEVGEELLTVNEETLWSGGRGSVDNYDGGNPNGDPNGDPKNIKAIYDGLADYYVNGTYTQYNMEDLKGDSRDQSGYDDGYQPLGELKFHFGHSGQMNYERTLDLDNGLATVRYDCGGVTYNREYFASNPHNVLVSRFTADKNGKLTFTVNFESKQEHSEFASASGRVGQITASGTVANNGLLHNTQIAVVADGGSVTARGSSIQVSNADSATVYLTAATDYANVFASGTTEYWYRTGETADKLNSRVKEKLDAAVGAGYNKVRAAHIKDYRNLYNRVYLDLGQRKTERMTDDLLHAYKNRTATEAEQRYLEVLTFQYGRYLLIAGSRENSQLPTTLQGIWNDRSGTDWNSDIHTNINLEMNYWLSGSCNLPECEKPLVDYVSKLKEPGGRTVKLYTGSDHGIMAHTQNTPFGYTAPGWEIGTWGWSPAAATWLLQNCYDYYQYSGDTELLKSTIYPMMKDQVLMYEDLLMVKDGRKVMPIALSPEIGPVTSGNTFEQSLIWQLYTDTVEAAGILGETVPQAWKDTLEKLDPIEIGKSKQIKEWYNEDYINSVENTSGHRHLSNLLGLFPGDCIDTPEEIAAAKVSLNNKNFGAVGKGNDPEGGWTYGQMIGTWARAGEGANAYFCVNRMLKTRFYENLWDYHNTAIFQIDGNYGYSAGVAEMLLQSNRDTIRLLPALPEQWKNGSVRGLLAEGGFEVSMSWKDSRVTEVSVKSLHGGSCTVKNPFPGKEIRANEQRLTQNSDGLCTFDTAAGKTYILKACTPARAQRNEQGQVVLGWDAEPDVTYTIYRREISK